MPKFLVIRLSSMGDIVLTSPVVRCLKRQVKDAVVHFLVKESFLPVIEHNPCIDKKIIFEKETKALVDRLREEAYDGIVDLHHNLRSAIIKKRLGAKSYSFRKLNFEKWLLVNFKINRMPALHVVDRYMDTVRPLGVKDDGLGLDFFVPPGMEIPPGLPAAYVAFIIGGKHATKMLPAGKAAGIIRNLSLPAVLIGGNDDRAMGDAIVSLLNTGAGHSPMPVNACGRYSIYESALVIKNAHGVISNDTGMMHVAAAFGKKIVSIWGSTVPEFGMTPFFAKTQAVSTVMEVSRLNCRPCSKIGFNECPKGHFRCMVDQNAAAIAAAVNAF